METQQSLRGRRRALPVVRDARDLERALRAAVAGEVRFDEGSRALYATDASNYRQVPIGVVVPRDVEDVVRAVAVCRAHGAPITSRGGGTGLAGQTCNAAVIIDFSKHVARILAVDPDARTAWVEPGLVLDRLRERAEVHHLTFGPDPATHNHCTLGGMLGNNSCGVHSVMAGNTAANVEELEVLLYDGTRFRCGRAGEADLRGGGRRAEIHRRLADLARRYGDEIRRRFPDIPRRVSGYDLPALLPENGFHVARALVGSEGTLVTILGAKLRLVPSPPERVLIVLGYPSVFEAGDHILEVLEAGPIGLEGMDDVLVEDMKVNRVHPRDTELLPAGKGWLLAEFGGATRAEAEAKARALAARLGGRGPTLKIFDDREQERTIWKVRESGLGATARVPGQPDTWEGWEDSAVPPARLGAYLRGLHGLFVKFGYRAALYGHFGQGCVHTRIPFRLKRADGVAELRRFLDEASDLVLAHGGSLSGEHGDGQSRAELLPKMFGPEIMRAFAELKAIFDPEDRMNPGKIVRPYRIDENLRLGPGYRPARPRTHFAFAADEGSFVRAAERCVGVGECRRDAGGTMCPSWRVTHDEQHSTRGRARLLFEMLRGDSLGGGWREPAVKDALDLCLSCKGCKGDCPVHVDMASYKAEFLSHYYAGRLRPRSAYAFGLVMYWARLAALAPGAVNAVTHAPLLGRLVKAAAGVDARRDLPRFAPATFRSWWRRRRRPAHAGGRPVVLWVDTWSEHFHPEAAIAATLELEAAGYDVRVPPPACCGRPLYDYGMLDTARKLLRRCVAVLAPSLRAGVPVVGLEPSCVSVFRDELVELLPDDDDARRLHDATRLFGDFLAGARVDGAGGGRRALLHGHCHQKALLADDRSAALLGRVGLDVHVLDAGCCGMAGGFGYERAHADVAAACGEHALLPAVRAADPAALVVADGFSCREQIRQHTDRRALTVAEAVHLVRTGGLPARPRPSLRRRLVLAAAAVVGVGLALRRIRR